jgi:hypothetical protein
MSRPGETSGHIRDRLAAVRPISPAFCNIWTECRTGRRWIGWPREAQKMEPGMNLTTKNAENAEKNEGRRKAVWQSGKRESENRETGMGQVAGRAPVRTQGGGERPALVGTARCAVRTRTQCEHTPGPPTGGTSESASPAG